MPVVLLCVFVAAKEWSESEMSRDMWPSFPGMLELCGTLSWCNNVEIPDSDECVKHNSLWLRNQHNDYSFRFTLPQQEFWESECMWSTNCILSLSWMLAATWVPFQGHFATALHTPTDPQGGALATETVQSSSFKLPTFLCDGESNIITFDELASCAIKRRNPDLFVEPMREWQHVLRNKQYAGALELQRDIPDLFVGDSKSHLPNLPMV